MRALLRLAASAIIPGVDAGGGRTRRGDGHLVRVRVRVRVRARVRVGVRVRVRGDGHLVGTRQPAVLLRLVLGHLG